MHRTTRAGVSLLFPLLLVLPVEAQSDEIADWKRRFRANRDEALQIQALDGLADALNASSEYSATDAVKALRIGLRADSIKVQVHAIQLIAKVDDIEAAGRGLAEAARRYERSLLKTWKQNFKHSGVPPGELLPQILQWVCHFRFTEICWKKNPGGLQSARRGFFRKANRDLPECCGRSSSVHNNKRRRDRMRAGPGMRKALQ